MNREELERLKKIAKEDNEDPMVTTLEPQIRTAKYAMFPEPKITQPNRVPDKGTSLEPSQNPDASQGGA